MTLPKGRGGVYVATCVTANTEGQLGAMGRAWDKGEDLRLCQARLLTWHGA